MSDPTPRRSLVPAAIVAALLGLLGAGAYFAISDPPAPGDLAPKAGSVDGAGPDADTAISGGAPAAASSSVAEEAPKGPARGGLDVPPASALDMATLPKVTPQEREAAVLGTLVAQLPELRACAAGWVKANPNLMAKAFFVFSIGPDGAARGLTLRFKSARDSDLDACFTKVLGAARFDSSSPEAKVFWPVSIGGASVVEPLTGVTGETP